MKPKQLPIFVTVIPVLFLMACTSVSHYSTIQQAQHQTNNIARKTDKTLWEMFGNPEDWELHVYSVPLDIRFFRPLEISDLKERKITDNFYHHYSSGHEIISAINTLKGIPFTDVDPPVDIRVLLEFKHKYKNETIYLINNGYTLTFHVERNIDGRIEKLPAVIIPDKSKYNVLKGLFSKES